MRVGKWVLGIAVLGLVMGGVAQAQYNPNELCLTNGSEYYSNGSDYASSKGNHGNCRLMPSWAHIPSTGGGPYPLKLDVVSFGGMQGSTAIDSWYWELVLCYVNDNHYAANNGPSFDIPWVFCSNTAPHIQPPMPIYGGSMSTVHPITGGQRWQHPSSQGGWFMNNLVVELGFSATIAGTTPWAGYGFNILGDCTQPFTVPSSNSIWVYIWDNLPNQPNNQYVLLSREGDCVNPTTFNGNKGRNYSITSDTDNGYLWYWNNACTGHGLEWDVCLLVCDIVTMAVNSPGDPANPYAAYAFDLAVTTLTPNGSGNCVTMNWCTLANQDPGTVRVIIGGVYHVYIPPNHILFGTTPYGVLGYRVPHALDVVTTIMVGFFASPINTQHTPLPGYPSYVYTTCVGAHTNFGFPFPPDPSALCSEVVWSSFAGMPLGMPPSAGHMATYF